jgi:hypothetical protein
LRGSVRRSSSGCGICITTDFEGLGCTFAKGWKNNRMNIASMGGMHGALLAE